MKRAASLSLQSPPAKRKLSCERPETSRTLSGHSSQSESRQDASKMPLNFLTPQPMVTIVVVGEHDEKHFMLHKNVLARYSGWFDEEFNTNPKEDSVAIKDSPEIFGYLAHWLYTQKVETINGNGLKLIEYAKLWALSDYLRIHDLTAELLENIKTTESGNTPQATLKAFLEFVYREDHDELKPIAVSKALCAVGKHRPEFILDCVPEAMMKDFSLAMMKGCVALPGWDKGLGFDGVKEATPPRKIIQPVHKRGKAIEDTYNASSISADSNNYDTTAAENGGVENRHPNGAWSRRELELKQDLHELDLFVLGLQYDREEEAIVKKEHNK